MWNAVYKKLWLVILVPFLAAGVAFMLTYKKARLYRSVATIEASIPDQPTKAQTLKDIQAQEPNQYYDNLVATMKTEVITSMVSYRLLLHDLEKEIAFRPPAIQYSDARRDLFRRILEKKLSSFELLSETTPTEATISQIIHNMDYDIARWIRDGEMTVERKPASSEIVVATSTEDPFLSAFASNTLSQEYIRYETSIMAPEPANDSIAYYRQEVDRLRKDMEARTGELNEASQKTKSSPTDELRVQRAKTNRISEYEMRIVEEEWQLNSLREQLAKVERPEVTETPRNSADVASNAKIQAARKKIDQLSALYTEGGSKDRKLDSIITILRKQVNDEAARLQTASKNSASRSASNPERDMLQSRIQRHEQNVAAIRNDIRKLKNTNGGLSNESNNEVAVADLRKAKDAATAKYNTALRELKTLEVRSGVVNTTSARASHHLILKAKALPSAEPESPWAILIVISAFVVGLAAVLVIIYVTRPAPTIPDDIFLRVNYANRQRRLSNDQQPVANNR